jgi:nucleoid DNA-binding protein
MTKDELLRKCIDKGVADEGTVSAVSHLFYVFLLSALQKGQRVEIPDFGTFGTRVTGVKRTRKIPYFEPDVDLAYRVNERYREMKYVVVGRYQEVPVVGDTTYLGKPAPYDAILDEVGKEIVVDTYHEVSVDDAVASSRLKDVRTPSKEKPLMPKFNLKGEETGEEPQPRLHEVEEEKGPGPIVQVLIALLILGLLTLALHFFGVIRLWGPEKTEVATFAEPEPPATMPATRDTMEAKPVTPVPVPTQETRPKPVPPPSTGSFTVQVSSWQSRSKAEAEIARLQGASLDAFVEEGVVEGETWYRVRIGRYVSRGEASEAAARFSQILENGAWVARVGS